MPHRLAPRAEAGLDDIWVYVAKLSSSLEVADRLIDDITRRFFALGCFPHIGRSREDDLGPGYRSLTVGDYVVIYRIEDDDVFILRVVHGRRDVAGIFGG